jgi:hypothetical protein
VQYRDGHISTCFNKDTRDIYIVHMCSCQLFYLFVIVIRYLFICACLFVIFVHLFYSLFDYLYICCTSSFLIDSLFNSLFKREKNHSDPELCSGISIPLTVHHHQDESMPIIHLIHTNNYLFYLHDISLYYFFRSSWQAGCPRSIVSVYSCGISCRDFV